MLYRVLLDIGSAIIFLTRIPIPWDKISSEPPDISSSQWSFPIVGSFIGLVTALITIVGIQLGFNSLIAACIGIGSSVLLTGALHEDGLADTFDGFGGGKTLEKKIAIMKDSTLGTYGTSSLIFNYLLRIAALSSISSHLEIICICVLASSSGRTSIVILRKISTPFSEVSSANTLQPANMKVITTCLLVCSSFFLFFGLAFLFIGLLMIILIPIVVSYLAKKQVGGINGDILGACAIKTELIFFLVTSTWFVHG
jgi:adenosylcobinamide-GDP ribazoletransferase